MEDRKKEGYNDSAKNGDNHKPLPERRNGVKKAVEAIWYSCTGCALYISEGTVHIYANRSRIMQPTTCTTGYSWLYFLLLCVFCVVPYMQMRDGP